ncbi:MAG: CARDB domain-containing protein [Chloroflexota bacterium]
MPRILRTISAVTITLALLLFSGFSGFLGGGAVQAQSSPDLVIQSITCTPGYPAVGEEATFYVTVKNQGSVNAGASQVAFYVDATQVTSAPAGALNAGAVTTLNFKWKVTIGAHVVKAVADYAHEVAESQENNNEGNFSFSPLAPDLVVQEIKLDPEEPSKDDTVSISVVIKNRGSSQSRFTKVALFLDDAPRGEMDVPVLAAGATITRSFTWAAKEGNHVARARVDTQDLVLESDENNNETILTFATQAPDLLVEIISWTPELPSKGDDVTFTVTIKNQGTGKADYFFVAFFVDDDSLGSVSVDPLAAGLSANTTFTWKSKTGNHEIKAVADSNFWLLETDEANNTKTVTFSPLSPDLIIKSVSWMPTSPSVGDTVTFTVIVENQGNGRSDSTNLAYYIEASVTGSQPIPAIDAGSTAKHTFTWTAEAGKRPVKVVADVTKTCLESLEDNNEKVVEFTPVAPDLVVQSITWEPVAPIVGDKITFTVDLKNQSSGKASASHASLYINNVLLGSKSIGIIEANGEANETFTWTVAPGQQNVRAVADSSNQNLENDENNNEKTFAFLPAAPDLVIQDIAIVPQDPSPGDKVTFTISVKNRGDGRAEYSHLSYDIDGTPRGYDEIQEIAAGAVVSRTFTWTAENGTHTVTAVADADENLVESAEDNNIKTLHLPPADLVINSVSWTPESPAAGETVTFTVTVSNQGSGEAGASRATYYVDDAEMSSAEVPGIGPGATETVTFTWTAAVNSPGIRFALDSSDTLAESDETNNEKSFVFAPAVPDLTVSAIDWALNSFQDTGEVTITITVENQGTGTSGGFYLTCFSDDVYLTSTMVDALAAGETKKQVFTWKGDSGVHKIRVVADSDKTITESLETNNEKTVTISTIMPDLFVEKVTWIPQAPQMGDLITFHVNVKNQGTGKADASRVAFYVDDEFKGYADLPAINAGAYASRSFTWLAEEKTQNFKLVVDSSDTVTEINETNNEVSKTLKLLDAPRLPGNNATEGDQGGSLLDTLPLEWWWLLVIVGVVLSITLGVVWMKSQ